MCISESWLLPIVQDRFINIPNFKIFRCDRGKGGGVCIYVRDELQVTLINTNVPEHPLVEDIYLTIQYRKQPSFIVGSIYRHPHAQANSFEYILDIHKSLILRNKPLFILGDLNDDLLDTNPKLNKIIKSAKLVQLINKPTRITPTRSSLLDVIITNKPEIVIKSDVFPCEIADHELISIEIDIVKPKRQPVFKTYRCLTQYSPEILCDSLLSETPMLNSLLQSDDIDFQVNTFTEVFTKCLNSCAPMVTKQITRPPAPWITNNLEQEIENRNNIQRELKKDRLNITLRTQYKDKKKKIKSDIRKAKTDYFKNQFHTCRGNSSKTWNTVNRLIPNKRNNSSIVDFEDKMKKAEEFNHYFANVGKKTFEKTQENISNVEQDHLESRIIQSRNIKFRPQPVPIETIILIIKNLNESRAFGCDGISLRFVRDALPIISFYITIIVNTSIVTGDNPQLWKHGQVVPQLKNGDPDEPSNYRPITLLPVLSKVLEKVITMQLVEYLETSHLISNNQHGFRTSLSTETALLKVTDEIYKNIDDKKITVLSLCDLSKAFDSINHEMLLCKLDSINIDSFWFEEYLKDRTQSVLLGDVESNKIEISYGVPQGSILGPVLFLIFINDMNMISSRTNCCLVQYADDGQFIHSGTIDNLPELVSNVENTLSLAKNYFDRNGLLINAKKTQCIFIGSRQMISRVPNDITINYDNNAIIPSRHVKNLGVYFDCYMTFDIHVEELYKKIMGILIYISRIKDNFEKCTRITVVESLVLSLINYCCKIWGSANKTMLQKVQKLQNFAAKVADGTARKYDHVTPILNDLKWMKIENVYVFNICLFVYKVLNDKLPPWLISLPTVDQVNAVRTRQANDLFAPRTSTDIGSRAILVKGPTLWNKLPYNIKEAGSLHIFKEKLRKYLLISQGAIP